MYDITRSGTTSFESNHDWVGHEMMEITAVDATHDAEMYRGDAFARMQFMSSVAVRNIS
jgi:hypothetical protein